PGSEAWLPAEQRVINNDFYLARRLHYASCNSVPMALTNKHHTPRAGTSFTKAVRCCAMMRQVAISNWNKTASAGFSA
ncbi:MAG TPA: hypothetical protein VFE25_16415, partial [Opitutaceae bacterium]|nr:hypothetical protein [Opitutaceae bacterium]